MEPKTKKKLGAGVASVAVVGAAVALTAGTFSYFSDQQSGGQEQIRAGTLALTMYESKSTQINLTNAAPSEQSLASSSINFHNAGSLSGVLRIGIRADGTDSSVFRNDVQLQIHGVYGLSGQNGTPNCDTSWCSLATLQHVTRNGARVRTPPHNQGAGQTKGISYDVRVRPDAHNNMQGDTGSFQFIADLVQNDSSGAPAGNPHFPAAPVTNSQP